MTRHNYIGLCTPHCSKTDHEIIPCDKPDNLKNHNAYLNKNPDPASYSQIYCTTVLRLRPDCQSEWSCSRLIREPWIVGLPQLGPRCMYTGEEKIQ